MARAKLEGHVREAALTRMSRMKDKCVHGDWEGFQGTWEEGGGVTCMSRMKDKCVHGERKGPGGCGSRGLRASGTCLCSWQTNGTAETSHAVHTYRRFTEMFTLDANKTPHMWTARQDIPVIARAARLAAAHVVAQLAVLRPPGGGGAEQQRAHDAVEEAVIRLAQADALEAASSGSTGAGVLEGWCPAYDAVEEAVMRLAQADVMGAASSGSASGVCASGRPGRWYQALVIAFSLFAALNVVPDPLHTHPHHPGPLSPHMHPQPSPLQPWSLWTSSQQPPGPASRRSRCCFSRMKCAPHGASS